MKSSATTVDNYLKEVPENRLEALTILRDLCQKHLPDYEENMAYSMPSYKSTGDVEVAFASQKQHICVYFLIHEVMLNNKEKLQGFNHGKGCIRFGNPKKIDFSLIEHLLKETYSSNTEPC